MKRLSTHLFALGTPPGPEAAVAIQFPFAGGSAHALREYGGLLPGYRHLAVHYPGRGVRLGDPPAGSVGEIAAAVAAEYLAVAPDRSGPLLIGHSMGGYVAVETALRLREAGVRCPGLVLSSSMPPGVVARTDSPLRLLSGERPLSGVSDEELTRALIDGGAVPADIVEEPELLAMVLPTLRHDCEIAAVYRVAGPSARLSCPVLAFGAHDDGAVPPEYLDGWRGFTDGPFTARLWPGDHFWFRAPQAGLAQVVAGAIEARPDSAVGCGGPASVDALVHEQVLARPEETAVVDGAATYTYRDLWEASGRVAGHLAARGVGEGDIVGIRVARGFRAIAAMLGVARTGAMYLPLNENDPERRRTQILRDAAPSFLLVDEERPGRLDDAVELAVGALLADAGAPPAPSGRTGPGTALYVMYTSGSTGVPKGVIVEHGGVLNLVSEPRLDLTAERVVAHCAVDAFDVSTFEIWGALGTGGTCVMLAPRDLLEADALGAAITEHGIDTLFVTTAVLNFLAEDAPPQLRRLRSLVFGGERASVRHLRLVLDLLAGAGTRLVHAYGPTEATMMSTLVDLTADNVEQAPIGTALHNLRAILLTESGEIVDGDGQGELCIAGPNLARGYLNRPELTAERFVTLPGPSGPLRVYRTGDECARTAGVLRFLGRRDGMVKVRSHRIELGEVEAGLCAHPDVLEAVVVLDQTAAEPRLTAYLRTSAAVAPGELRRFLAERLPGYMIPAKLHTVAELPLGATGKVDRAALAAADGGRPA